MKIIYCDFCEERIGSVDTRGVEFREGCEETLRIGKDEYKEICGKCYKKIWEFIEELKKKK